MIDSARSDGADISLDTYPYLPGCTTLASLLPSWASAGGPAETLRRIEDEAAREKIRIAIEVTGCDGGHGIPTNWDEIQVSRGADPAQISRCPISNNANAFRTTHTRTPSRAIVVLMRLL
jgi:hypothetical protein